jgi:hypothetical protein
LLFGRSAEAFGRFCGKKYGDVLRDRREALVTESIEALWEELDLAALEGGNDLVASFSLKIARLDELPQAFSVVQVRGDRRSFRRCFGRLLSGS